MKSYLCARGRARTLARATGARPSPAAETCGRGGRVACLQRRDEAAIRCGGSSRVGSWHEIISLRPRTGADLGARNRRAAVPGRRDSRTLRPRRLRTKQAEAATRSGVFWPVVSGSKSRFCARGRARSGSAAVPGRPPSAGLRRTGSNVRAERPRRLNAKTCSEKPAGTIRHDQAGFGAIRWFFDKKVLTTDEHR